MGARDAAPAKEPSDVRVRLSESVRNRAAEGSRGVFRTGARKVEGPCRGHRPSPPVRQGRKGQAWRPVGVFKRTRRSTPPRSRRQRKGAPPRQPLRRKGRRRRAILGELDLAAERRRNAPERPGSREFPRIAARRAAPRERPEAQVPLARLDTRQGAPADPRQGAGGAGRVDPRPPDPGLRHSQDRLPIVAGFRVPSSARRGVPGGRQGCLPKTLNVICRSASRAGSCRNRQASSGTGALVAEAAWTRSRP